MDRPEKLIITLLVPRAMMTVMVSSSLHHCLALVLMIRIVFKSSADILPAPAQSSLELRLAPLQALHDTSDNHHACVPQRTLVYIVLAISAH